MAHPPSGPSQQDIQAALTLAEHLPQGYTSDLVGEDSGSQRGAAGDPPESSAASASLPSPSVQSATGGARGSATDGVDGEEDAAAAGGRSGTESEAGLSSSLMLQGGDVHRSLFRMAEAVTAPANNPHHRRTATFHGMVMPSGEDEGGGSGHDSSKNSGPSQSNGDSSLGPMPVRDLMAPQGFRRDFLLRQQQQRQQQRQKEIRQRHAAMQRRQTAMHVHRVNSFGAARLPITRNFVEFLELYGQFADEDLGTSDEEDEAEEEAYGEGGGEGDEGEEDGIEEEEESVGRVGRGDLERGSTGAGERQPLLGRRRSSAVTAAAAATANEGQGKKKAGMAQAFFTLFKAFVGTGIMFLPKAYNNGGMVFSTVTLLAVSLLSMAGFQLLLRCRQHCGGGAAVGYGDIGLAIAGPHMRRLVLGAIALSQLGFVCAGMVFCAENLASFAAAAVASSTADLGGDGATTPAPVVSTNTLIALEVAVLVPLAFVRDIARLGPAALLGDVFIGLGLVYMYSYDVAAVAARGWRADPTAALWFNPAGYALTVGAAIFTFEGIGLILPIQSSMAEPARFGRLLAVVMVLITALYVSVGALGYAAFGTATRTEVIDNYPRASRLVQAVQCLYALAVLAGLPVMLFPAVRIVEAHAPLGLGGRRGKRNPAVKWAKNGLRAALVAACGVVAAGGGAGRLDQFVALIGSLACVPLLFVFPPFLHYRAVAASPWAKAADGALMAVGCVAMVFTTAVTLKGI